MSQRMKMRNRVSLFLFSLLSFGAIGCGSEELRDPAAVAGELPWNASGLGSVTDVYGLARVQDGNFYAESKTRPWSSYWFPARDTSLFEPISNKEDAPLQKFDKWARKAKKAETSAPDYVGAADYERDVIYGSPVVDAWAGLCNAWAKAAIMEPEPTKPVELEGVKFSVFDLKALLIKSYENTEGFQAFGERFNGRRGENYDDIFPDQFHRLVQAELFEKGRPFIMDRDAGIQVWNVPVYKAEITIKKDESNPRVMHVHTTLGTAGTRDDLNFVGTWQVVYDYYYDLHGITLEDGTFQVQGGVWTGSSVDNHPDFLTVVPEKKIRKSDNIRIVTDWVDEIAAKGRTSMVSFAN